nr:beta lactamase [Streptomyces cacaoi]
VACGQASGSESGQQPGLGGCGTSAHGSADAHEKEFRALEKKFDAHPGVYAIDTRDGQEITHRADERFAYGSTFKALQAGAILAQVLRDGREVRRGAEADGMDKVVHYGQDAILPNSPVTEKHVADGMSLRELCDAVVAYSDNTAANLLFDQLGGRRGSTRVLKQLGDHTTSMDRYEQELGSAVPGDPRDTSTPRAFAEDLRAFAVEDGEKAALAPNDREQLNDWMSGSRTGDALIRAGVPKDWKVEDKSGQVKYGTRNDIAVVRPPGRAPIVVSVMSHGDTQDAEPHDELVAEAGLVVADGLK